ncbi:MAG: hypothetical protein IJY23_00975 [Clostridia bacterium]|nr:hypothetical protein [Clostridia bacterium]
MKIATREDLEYFDRIAEERKAKILNAPDELKIKGKTYYVSSDGDDNNDGLSPKSAWKSLVKASNAELREGDGVLFRRGDLFRGTVYTKPGVSYGAYGEGDKPKIYSWDKDLADPALWELYDSECNIWHLKEKILDCGTLVFNGGEKHSFKHIPSYVRGKFVCRNDESRDFVMSKEMTTDLDIYWYFVDKMTTLPTLKNGKPYSEMEDGDEVGDPGMDNFPVPDPVDAMGDLYLRCNNGNPGEIFDSIEAVSRRFGFVVGENNNVRIDNICLKYTGCHCVAATGKRNTGLHVSNCEMGWVGGVIHQYLGIDPNYPEGGRGSIGRFGNCIEIYGGCDSYTVENCYLYQCYDAGMTHQRTTGGEKVEMTNVLYKDNLVERCVYSIEYFLDMTCGDTESYMDNIEMCGNILRFAGSGWGQQRHNKHTPAHIKGWSFTNVARNYRIHDNVFDRSAYRLLHLVASKEEHCPEMYSNTYIQHDGGQLGQYGGNENGEPKIEIFDDNAEVKIENVFGEKNAKVYIIKE